MLHICMRVLIYVYIIPCTLKDVKYLKKKIKKLIVIIQFFYDKFHLIISIQTKQMFV